MLGLEVITNSRDFVFWLQGFLDVGDKTLNEKDVAKIRDKLNGAFHHEIDPSMGDAAHQIKLSTAHDPKSPNESGLRAMCYNASEYG
jgi:hypothetical protein